VVDRCRKVLEEPREAVGVGGVEGGTAEGAELVGGVLDAVGIAAGEDDLGPFGPCPTRCLEADPGAAPNHDDGLPDQRRLALHGGNRGCGGHGCAVRVDPAAAGSPVAAISRRRALMAAR
jgi:hypothetical protein